MNALVLLELVFACNSLGEYQKAIEYGHQALALRQAVGRPLLGSPTSSFSSVNPRHH